MIEKSSTAYYKRIGFLLTIFSCSLAASMWLFIAYYAFFDVNVNWITSFKIFVVAVGIVMVPSIYIEIKKHLPLEK